MKDRIKKYMDYKSITAGELSSRIDVQRSNISHILNGRNKPGASFIEKLLVNFPDLNARWLFTGEGEMIENQINSEKKAGIQTSIFTDREVAGSPNNELSEVKKRTEATTKQINKLVILYSDGTFTDYIHE